MKEIIIFSMIYKSMYDSIYDQVDQKYRFKLYNLISRGNDLFPFNSGNLAGVQRTFISMNDISSIIEKQYKNETRI